MLTSWYERNFLTVDLVAPIALALAVVVVAKLTVGDSGVQESIEGNRATVYGATAGVAGSLLGFTITLIPLLHALLSLDGLKVVRESRHAPDLFAAMMHAVVALGIVCGTALLAMLFDRDRDPRILLQYAMLVLVAVAVWKLVSAVRLMWLALGLAIRSYRSAAPRG